MKITFTFDTDEQKQVAIQMVPAISDSNELEVDDSQLRRLLALLRNIIRQAN